MKRVQSLLTATMLAGLFMAGPAMAQQAPEKPFKPNAETAKTAPAEIRPSAPGYKPTAEDEKGLWQMVDDYERDLKQSKFVIDDPALNTYVKGLLCKTVGDARCANVRLYLVRTPHFNASMAPNGMMQVWTGLLFRTRNEAELAAVLAHEFTHFDNWHSLRAMRDMRKKTDAMAWLSFVPFGYYAQLGVMGSIFGFSREMEREADHGSLGLLSNAGYTPASASKIWEQLRNEMDATAKERKHRSRKNDNGGFFATHPNSKERMDVLAAEAAKIARPEDQTGEAEYREALKDWWPRLIDDQVKRNDFGGTEYLLGQLAAGRGWTSELLYGRGEIYRARGKGDDFLKAAGFYQQAIDTGAAFPESWRGLGLALMRAGQTEAGKAALNEYLKRKPDASDRAMIAAMAGGA